MITIPLGAEAHCHIEVAMADGNLAVKQCITLIIYLREALL